MPELIWITFLFNNYNHSSIVTVHTAGRNEEHETRIKILNNSL